MTFRQAAFGAATVGVAAVLIMSVTTLDLESNEVAEFFARRPTLGPLLFVAIMWAVQPFGVPGVFFMIPAALVWPAPTAIALSWIGNMGASILAFGAARRAGHDWAQRSLGPRLRRWDDRIARGGIAPVVALRVLTGQLPLADWLLGVSAVRVTPFVIGTAIGIVPGIVVVVLSGRGVAGWLGRDVLLAILAVAALSLVLFSRWRARRRATAVRR